MGGQRIFFDINCGIGRMDFRDEHVPYSKENLLRDMRYYRIQAAAVYSHTARDYAFTEGDRLLLSETAGSDRLFAVGTAIPGIRYEVEGGFAYYDGLIQKGVRALKCYPRRMSFPFTPFALVELADYMAGKKLPLFIDISEVSWTEIKDAAQAFPNLNMVLMNVSWAQNRFLFPLLDKCANVHFDISSNQANDILEVCKRHFGVNRVLFGTNYPSRAPGGMKALIEYSLLTDSEKDNVACLNAAALMGADVADISPYAETECELDELAMEIERGQPVSGAEVIDAHTHLVNSRHMTVSQIPIFGGSEDEMMAKCDRLGIRKIFISPWEGLRTNGQAANATTAAAQAKYPERIMAYAMANPNYPDDIGTVVDYQMKHEFIGLKPYYSWNKYDLLGVKYAEWFEFGNSHRLIMLVHSGGEAGIPQKVDALAEKYPDMTFLLAHSGASFSVADAHIDVAVKRPNVYLELTFTTMTNGVLEYIVDKIGAERVIFGTDMPMRDPAPQLGWVCYARISVEEKAAILGQNIKRLAGRCFKQLTV